eukprot:7384543-Prymnesium_polylepis.1
MDIRHQGVRACKTGCTFLSRVVFASFCARFGVPHRLIERSDWSGQPRDPLYQRSLIKRSGFHGDNTYTTEALGNDGS